MDHEQMKACLRGRMKAAKGLCGQVSRSFLGAARGAFKRDPGAVIEVALNIAVVLVLVITVTL